MTNDRSLGSGLRRFRELANRLDEELQKIVTAEDMAKRDTCNGYAFACPIAGAYPCEQLRRGCYCHELHLFNEHNREQNEIASAWKTVLEWLEAYEEEERHFSRYRDDVILDGIMTAEQRRAVYAAIPRRSRSKPDPETCPDCGQKVPLLFACHQEECPIPGSY